MSKEMILLVGGARSECAPSVHLGKSENNQFNNDWKSELPAEIRVLSIECAPSIHSGNGENSEIQLFSKSRQR